MVDKEVLDRIKKNLIKYGDGSFKFETRDIEALVQAYEKLDKIFMGLMITLNQELKKGC